MERLTLAAPFSLAAEAADADALRVDRGHVDVFSVRLAPDGTAVGRRRHLCRRHAGEALFAVAGIRDFGLLAVPSVGAVLTPVDPALAGATAQAALVEGWVLALGAGVFAQQPPKEAVRPVPGEPMAVAPGTALRLRDGLVWVSFDEGAAAVSGRASVRTGPAAMPVGSAPWLVTTAPSQIVAETTDARQAAGALAGDLAAFHAMVLDALADDERRAVETEGARAARRAEAARAALREGTTHLASILQPDDDAAEAATSDALLRAVRRVGCELGIEIVEPPVRDRTSRRDRVGEIARASRTRVRKVILADDWWRTDIGPVLAMAMPETEGQPPRPVALVWRSGRMVLVEGGTETRLTEATAGQVHPVAFSFYRPFPDRVMTAMDVARFGLRGAGRDLAAVLAIGLATGLLGLLTPYVTGTLFSTAIPEADRSLLAQMVAALVASALGTAAFHATRGMALLRLESRMDVTVQAAVWDRLLKLPTPFFRRFAAGDLAGRAGAISAIRQLLSGATITSLLGAVFALLYVGQMLWYSVPLSLWATGLTAVALAATLGVSWLQLRHQREVAAVQSRLQGRVLQFLTGLTKLRVAGAEAKAFAHWASDFGRQRTLQMKARRSGTYLTTFNAAFPILSSIVLFAVMMSGDEGPLLPIGTFVAFHAAFGAFTSSVLSLSGAFTSVLLAVPLYEQAEPILAALPEVDESKADPGQLVGRLALEHVTFRYDPDGPPTLNDVTVRAEPGEFVALVGPSGSGKSTVLRLLLGFETPEAGVVLYDDQDLAEVDVQAVRRQLGVVLQSGGLMQGDLFTNIAGSSGATHDDAWEAARMAGLDHDVKQMPMGMHTVVSEGGTTLSGGQRQRLLIARAVVGRPRLLFFDEATSALDNHTQAIVSRSLEALESTRVVVAHRLSTIQHADRIYVIDRGRVVQQGTYGELMAQPGLFAELAARQIA